MTEKSECQRCHKRRHLKHVSGPGLHPKGEDICRPCNQAAIMAAKIEMGYSAKARVASPRTYIKPKENING